MHSNTQFFLLFGFKWVLEARKASEYPTFQKILGIESRFGAPIPAGVTGVAGGVKIAGEVLTGERSKECSRRKKQKMFPEKYPPEKEAKNVPGITSESLRCC